MDYHEKKRLVTCVRLAPEDAIDLIVLSRKNGITPYKFVEKLILDRIQDYRDNLNTEYDDYSYEEED